MRRNRYLGKLEAFEDEINFINSHTICDEVTKRALLHSLQVCVGISMDIVSMLSYDLGLVVEDDYTNIEKLTKDGVLVTVDHMKNSVKNLIYTNFDSINTLILGHKPGIS